MGIFITFITVVTVVVSISDRPVNAQTKFLPGVEELYRLDTLPTFKQSVKVASISSYDRTGGNDDGFSGKYSFLRKESSGLVIADLKGPGVIYRIWTPTPTDDMVEFYFDGEATPRIRVTFRDLFSGNQFPFLSPIAGSGAGGFYCYLPLPFKESCKVVVKADKLQFYQINYATYPSGTQIESYAASPSMEFKEHLDRARKLFALFGSDISSYTTSNKEKLQTHRFNQTLAPGKTVTIFETTRPGRIAGLRLGPASAFAGKDRDVLIKIYWDGENSPAIACPVSDFFGYAWGHPAMRSLVLGTSENTNYIYLPMPYDKSARIQLVSEKPAGPGVAVQAEVKFTAGGKSKDEGRLYALWRRENLTDEGRPFTFVDTQGRGHVVGCVLQAQGTQPGAVPEFFEGDDQTAIDGEMVIHGTGSEDFFNGGWYDVPGRWEGRVSLPLSGCLDFKRHLSRTGGYRFMLTDAYAYKQSIRSTIEHGPVGNKIPTDYIAVTFLYSESRPSAHLGLPKLEERKVHDPDKIVFTPGFNTPLHAFSWANAVLAKKAEKISGAELRFLSLKGEGRDVFGHHYISFICEMPAAGKYQVSIEAVEGPSQAIVQLFRYEAAVGKPADLFAGERRKSGVIPMGILEMKEGDNHLFFKLVGKHNESAGLGFDLVRIIFEKVG
jgi:hypothetical protein